jgi:hypothetical protein
VHTMSVCGRCVLLGALLASVISSTESTAGDWNPISNEKYTIQTGPCAGQAGRLIWGIRIEPAEVDLGTITPDYNTNVPIHIDLVNAPSLNISNAQCSSPDFKITWQALVPGTHYMIEIRPQSRLRYGSIRDELDVTTDKKWQPVLKIPISAVVTGPLDVLDWWITVPYDKNVPALPRYIKIVSRDGTPFKIQSVIPPDQHVRVGNIWQEGITNVVELQIQPVPELENKYLEVSTDVPSMTKLEIPIHVSIAGK